MRKLSLLSVIILALMFLVRGSPAAAQDNTYIPMLLWPLPDEYRWVMAYPDDGWTWWFLGLAPDKTCPANSKRERDKSFDYWRDEGTNEEADWHQASRGSQYLACYWHHAGTDIFTDPGTPVYAVADGTITNVATAEHSGTTYAYVEVEHNRLFRGVRYFWKARYLHLQLNPPVTAGEISEGALLGYVIFLKNNSHLHFEVDDFWADCLSPTCITNPYGDTALWIDYADDGKIDPATDGLNTVLTGENLVKNADFSEGMQHWATSPGVQVEVQQDGTIIAQRGVDMPIAWIRQVLGYRFAPDTRLNLRLEMGNTSGVTKYVGVVVRDPETWAGALTCLFALPPNTPVQTYHMQGTVPAEWLNAILHLSLNPADSTPGVVFDAISIARDDTLPAGGTLCMGAEQ